jgi:hypothetical protein
LLDYEFLYRDSLSQVLPKVSSIGEGSPTPSAKLSQCTTDNVNRFINNNHAKGRSQQNQGRERMININIWSDYKQQQWI